MKTRTLLCCGIALLLSAIPLWAEPEKKPTPPIQIEADHMMSNQKESSVYFSGKVEAEQGDVIIHADEMTVYYASESSKGATPPVGAQQSQQIERLTAKGQVEITKEGWIAKGDAAEYFERERKVVLTGNTKVWQENNLVTGDTFILYLDEGKSIVERSAKKDERVKAFFYPKSDPSK